MTKTRKSTKILSFVLSIVMVLGLVPGMSMTAAAATRQKCPNGDWHSLDPWNAFEGQVWCNNCDDYVTPVTESVPPYDITLTGGANATADPSDKTSQSGLSGAMTTVTYTANSGCQFPATSGYYTTTNGITVTRTSDTVVTVSGTPTADMNITVPDALVVWSENQEITETSTLNQVIVTADIKLTIPEGKTLTVNGGINASGKTLTVEGAGTLIVNGANGADGSNANGGNGGAGVDGSITVQSGSAALTGGSGGIGGQHSYDPGANGHPGKAVSGTITGKAEESDNGSDYTAITGTASSKRYVKVEAAAVTEYPLWVGGTQVTSENAEDTDGTRGWSYDADTNTLTLNDYTYTGAESEYATIYTTEDLMINLVGNNTVTNTSTNNNSFGIFVEDDQNQKNLTITGNGTLTANGGNSASTYSCGICVGGTLTIDVNTTVKANGGSCADSAGVAAFGGLHVKGTLEATGGLGTNSSYGIYNTQVEIAEGSVLTAIGGTQAINGVVNNAIAGAGWKNVEGTEGERTIAVNIGGQYLTNDKKVQFPALGTVGNPWLIGKENASDVKAWLTGEENNKTLHISGTGAMKDFEVGYNVEDYSIVDDIPWYNRNVRPNPAEQIKTVEISSGVTGIGDYAFIG